MLISHRIGGERLWNVLHSVCFAQKRELQLQDAQVTSISCSLFTFALKMCGMYDCAERGGFHLITQEHFEHGWLWSSCCDTLSGFNRLAKFCNETVATSGGKLGDIQEGER